MYEQMATDIARGVNVKNSRFHGILLMFLPKGRNGPGKSRWGERGGNNAGFRGSVRAEKTKTSSGICRLWRASRH